MSWAITGSSLISCLGDEEQTWLQLLEGSSGVGPLTHGDPDRLNVASGYEIDEADAEGLRLAGRWLARCVTEALAEAGVDPTMQRVAVLVGTGLRELRAVEQWHADGARFQLPQLHFGSAVRAVAPDVTEVHTIANACAASGYALALGGDLLALGEADAVVVAGCDTVTESMLAMIGRIGAESADMVRPFDTDSAGVLLGEGAVAVVLQPAGTRPALGLLRSVAIGCDAHHETAPHLPSIVATIRQAHDLAGIKPDDLDLVVAHGTATALNDPTEATALTEVFGDGGPPVTAFKGALGHTSGAAALMGVVLALKAFRDGRVPTVVGLRSPVSEAERLALVVGAPLAQDTRLAQVNAFGFGGVNAVAVVEAVGA